MISDLVCSYHLVPKCHCGCQQQSIYCVRHWSIRPQTSVLFTIDVSITLDESRWMSHNLVIETILWEMSSLFDYSLWVALLLGISLSISILHEHWREYSPRLLSLNIIYWNCLPSSFWFTHCLKCVFKPEKLSAKIFFLYFFQSDLCTVYDWLAEITSYKLMMLDIYCCVCMYSLYSYWPGSG